MRKRALSSKVYALFSMHFPCDTSLIYLPPSFQFAVEHSQVQVPGSVRFDAPGGHKSLRLDANPLQGIHQRDCPL